MTYPTDAVKPSPGRRATLVQRVDQLAVSHFRGHELMVGVEAVKDGVSNGFPPPQLHDNVVPTLLVADLIRERCGWPITITSAYRHRDYNEAVGGASMSQHRAFRALDLQPAGVVKAEKVARIHEVAKELHGERNDVTVDLDVQTGPVPADYGPGGLDLRDDSFRFVGGIGRYSRFVHIDTRGSKARWDKRNRSVSAS